MFTKAMKSSIACLFVIILSALIGGGCPPSEEKGPVATGLVISSPDYAVAGDPITVTVRAIDNGGKTVPSYSGTIQFTSTDTGATIPQSYTFVEEDEGVHTFTAGVTLTAAGQMNITVSDGKISGSKAITVAAGPAASFTLNLSPVLTTTGEPITASVKVWDAFGNLAENYKGPVSFTSTDALAALPGTYFFTPDDAGIHVFTLYVNSPGSRTIFVSDNILNIQVSADVTVYMYTVPHYYIKAEPGYAGFVIPFAITDPSTGNPITGAVSKITATVSNSNAERTAIDEVGGGTYNIGLRMSVATTFLLTVTCVGCPGNYSAVSIVTVTPGDVVIAESEVGNPSLVNAPVVNVATGTDISPTISVTLRDKFRNTVPFMKGNISVVFTDATSDPPIPFGLGFLRKIRDNANGTYTLWISNGSISDGVFLNINGDSKLVQEDVQYTGSSISSVPKETNFVSMTITSYEPGATDIPVNVGRMFTAQSCRNGYIFTGSTVSFSVDRSGSLQTTTAVTPSSYGTWTRVSDSVLETIKLTTTEPSTGARDGVTINVVSFTFAKTTASCPVTTTAQIVARVITRDNKTGDEKPLNGRTVTAYTDSPTTSPASSSTGAPLGSVGDGKYTLDLSDTNAEIVTVTLTDNRSTAKLITVVNFLPGVAIESITPTTQSVPAGSNVTVTVKIKGVTPATGRTVTFAATGGATIVGGVIDNGDGTYSANITDSNAETVYVTATDESGVKSTPVQIEFVLVNLSISPQTARVPQKIVLTATIQGGTPASGRSLTVVPWPPSTATASGPTDKGGGIYTFDITDTIAESFTIAVYDNNSLAESSIGGSFTVGVTLVPSATPVPIGGTIDLTATLVGFGISDITGRNVTITSSSPSIIFTALITDIGGGQYTTQIMSSIAQKALVTAMDVDSGASETIEVEFVGISVEAGATHLPVGGTTTLTVRVGPGGGRDVSLSSTGSAMINPPVGKTDSTGIFRAYIRDSQPETVTVTATDNASGASAQILIDFSP